MQIGEKRERTFLDQLSFLLLVDWFNYTQQRPQLFLKVGELIICVCLWQIALLWL